jgi:hypothetical protein
MKTQARRQNPGARSIPVVSGHCPPWIPPKFNEIQRSSKICPEIKNKKNKNKTMNTALENQNDEMKQRRKALRKRVSSKLDLFTEPLLQMEAEMKTIDQMLAWLKERGVTTARGNVSHFLKRRREEAGQKELREQMKAKADKRNDIEEWLARNPRPDPGAVMEIFNMQVMELATEGAGDPKLLKLADKLARTAMGFVNDQSREAYRTRKLALEEAKQAERVKCERTRGLALCRDEVKKQPAVVDIYRAAFDALGKCRKENGE